MTAVCYRYCISNAYGKIDWCLSI